MNRCVLYFLFLILLFSIKLEAQSDSTQTLSELSFSPTYGTIVKHTPTFRPQITESSMGMEMTYLVRKNAKTNFLKHFNYPYLGGGIVASYFGNHDVFGTAMGAMGCIKFLFMERTKSNFFLRIGAGLGYLSSTHQTSYENNVIGSHINVMANIVGEYNYRFSPLFQLAIGGGITHFSNARTTKPNLGINYLNVHAGLNYSISKPQHFTKPQIDNFSLPRPKNSLIFGLGMSDKGGDDQHHVLPTFSLHYHHRHYTSMVNALIYGASVAYKNDNYDDNIYGLAPNSDISLNFGDEIIFGKLSLGAILGVYLYPINKTSKYWYQKYAINYTIPLKGQKFNLMTGVQLKTHYGAAELAECKLGIQF